MANELIPKSAINALDKFNKDLEAFGKECGEEHPYLFEDANTMFKVIDPKLDPDSGVLTYRDENGDEVKEVYILEDEDEDGKVYEYWDEYNWYMGMNYWRSALRRAKRYWATDCETLDKIQDGEMEDPEDE